MMKFCKAFFNEKRAKEKAAKMKSKFVQIIKMNENIFVQNYKEEARPWMQILFEGHPKELKQQLSNKIKTN